MRAGPRIVTDTSTAVSIDDDVGIGRNIVFSSSVLQTERKPQYSAVVIIIDS